MSQLVDGTLSTVAAGTAVPFSDTDVVVDWIRVSAHEDNKSPVMVGTVNVVAAVNENARGAVVPQTNATLGSETLPLTIRGPLNLKHLYLDSIHGDNNEGVYYLYLENP